MSREKFPLTTDQLQLLLAFETEPGLAALAKRMGRDASVVSRALQRMAEELPVLEKHARRWRLTALGREINWLTRQYLSEIQSALPKTKPRSKREAAAKPYQSENAALLVINAQAALLGSGLGKRNNREAEDKILMLLKTWRKAGRPIIHVQHVSDIRGSVFYRKGPGVEFLPMLAPLKREHVIEKGKSSAFAGTRLEKLLMDSGANTLVVTGFTGNECIDATARQSSELGFATYVVSDATASFDLDGPDGRVLKADRVHRLVLANLNALCATVLSTDTILG